MAELEAVDLSTLSHYRVGYERLTNLWQLIAWLSGVVGHVNGQVECLTTHE
jgi:hypothetical protein